jgi:nucleoside-diphosphate-sugar epimerase
MRVFVTGASGFVGSAVVQELLRAGHQVIGLTRSEAGAKAVAAAGAQVHRGDVEDLDSLRQGVALADGIIHTAFNHDFSKFKANCEADRRAIAAMAAALAGSDKPLIVTAGTGLLNPGRLATEDDLYGVDSSVMPRVATEEAAMAAMAAGACVSVVRLPPSVHGDGDHGFVPLVIGFARQKGVSVYSGEGRNRWSAVHRLDAARAYRLVLEKGAGGVRYHAVAEQGIPFRDIATVIGKRLNVPVVSKSPEAAAEHFGWFAHFAAIDNLVSSERTQKTLGWAPTQPGLLPDLDRPQYFAA